MSSEDEYLDCLEPLPSDYSNGDLVEQVMRAKRGEPNKFASHWEMDEEDVDEATEEEIQNNPTLKMLWAAENDKLSVVESLITTDPASVSVCDKDGYTPLHRAAYNNHVAVAQLLLDHGADLEMKTADGWTPLHSASNWGNTAMVSLLLAAGADVNAQSTGKQTSLHLAASNSNSKQTLELLLMAPFVDHTLTNVVGETAKQLAERTCKYHYLFEIADQAVNQLLE